jgi:hypothetical protein
MAPSDYSFPYDLDDPCPFFYGQTPPAPLSQFSPTILPDLYYEYRPETPPSSTSSEIISTPPSVPAPLLPLTWESAAYTHNSSCHPNALMGLMDTYMVCYECPKEGSCACVAQHGAKQETPPHTMSYPQHFPLSTDFVSPSDTFHGPRVPIPTPSSTPRSPSSPKLYQPRPSRRIPIVNLNELASACETFQPGSDLRASDRNYPSYQSPKQPSTGLFAPIRSPVVKQGSSEGRILLCSCGCMESYRLR